METERNRETKKAKENSSTPRRTFSVSNEFKDILTEIDTMPNMSRFICEAIKEKLERVKNPGKDIADALANFVQIQNIISQPNQTHQSLSHTEGKVVSPSPSVPLTQEYKEPQKTFQEVSASAETVREESKPVEAIEAEAHTRHDRIESKTVPTEPKETVAEPEPKQPSKTQDETPSPEPEKNDALEEIRKKAMASYFNKD